MELKLRPKWVMMHFFLKNTNQSIKLNDKEIIKKLDVCRQARNSYNKDLLVQNVQLVDLNDDNTNIRSGRIRINKGTARFECFFSSWNQQI